MNKQEYNEYCEKKSPKSPIIKNCLFAFFTGGLICTLGQIFINIYKYFGFSKNDAGTLCSITLVFLSSFLTGLNIYPKIAKYAGAGTIVPITGFANSVASPALEAKSEGYILGVGAKIFTIAGPVILYGTLASFICGILYYMIGLA